MMSPPRADGASWRKKTSLFVEFAASLQISNHGRLNRVSPVPSSYDDVVELWNVDSSPENTVQFKMMSGTAGVEASFFSVPANCELRWRLGNLYSRLVSCDGGLEALLGLSLTLQRFTCCVVALISASCCVVVLISASCCVVALISVAALSLLSVNTFKSSTIHCRRAPSFDKQICAQCSSARWLQIKVSISVSPYLCCFLNLRTSSSLDFAVLVSPARWLQIRVSNSVSPYLCCFLHIFLLGFCGPCVELLTQEGVRKFVREGSRAPSLALVAADIVA